jgi:parallel beta-helix repeat protein
MTSWWANRYSCWIPRGFLFVFALAVGCKNTAPPPDNETPTDVSESVVESYCKQRAEDSKVGLLTGASQMRFEFDCFWLDLADCQGKARDADGDCVGNGLDNCPNTPNQSQSKTSPGVKGDACSEDIDRDLVANDEDNCPFVANRNQETTPDGKWGAACAPLFVDGSYTAGDADGSEEKPFRTIGQAIDKAVVGGTVLVGAGTHYLVEQTLVIGKPVTLMALSPESPPKITCDSDMATPAILVKRTSHVAIDGLAISGCAFGGIQIVESDHISIKNNELTGNGIFGMWLFRVQGEISNNTISETKVQSVADQGVSLGQGINVQESAHLKIIGNTLDHNTGISMAVGCPSSKQKPFDQSRMVCSTRADHSDVYHPIEISQNRIQHTLEAKSSDYLGIGLFVGWDHAPVSIKENVLVDNSSIGLFFSGTISPSVQDNEITNMGLNHWGSEGYGVFFVLSTGFVFERNTIENSFSAGAIVYESSGEIISNKISTSRKDAGGNFGHGVLVFKESQVQMRDNTISKSDMAGVFYDRSNGTVTKNTIDGSGLYFPPKSADKKGPYDIWIQGTADSNYDVTLIENTLSGEYFENPSSVIPLPDIEYILSEVEQIE